MKGDTFLNKREIKKQIGDTYFLAVNKSENVEGDVAFLSVYIPSIKACAWQFLGMS